MYKQLEKIMVKISNFKNHQRFSLRCLSRGLIPVSPKLKNNIRIHKGTCITYKAERRLLNERIRNINNTIEHYEHERYMYRDKLILILEPDMFKNCEEHINVAKKTRHLKVFE